MNNNTLRALVVLAVGVAAAGCSRMVRQPEVTLDTVRVESIGLSGGTLVAKVHVFNPNVFDLATERLSYDLQLAHPDSAGKWVSFTTGTIDQRVTVQSNGATIIEVPIAFRYEDLGPAVRSILDTGRFNYRIVGNVSLAEPVQRAFPYAKTGAVTVASVRR